jgi:hypothetical protein
VRKKPGFYHPTFQASVLVVVCLLQVQDIQTGLQGRQAEMYWPDDNMWYLIEIHTVNVVNKTAIIVYRTGEVEELNLSEIANEGHMSLIEL